MAATTRTSVTYAHGSIADKHYPVTGAKLPSAQGYRLIKVGERHFGNLVTGIVFYTGFAGCPARYYLTLNGDTRVSTIANA